MCGSACSAIGESVSGALARQATCATQKMSLLAELPDYPAILPIDDSRQIPHGIKRPNAAPRRVRRLFGIGDWPFIRQAIRLRLFCRRVRLADRGTTRNGSRRAGRGVDGQCHFKSSFTRKTSDHRESSRRPLEIVTRSRHRASEALWSPAAEVGSLRRHRGASRTYAFASQTSAHPPLAGWTGPACGYVKNCLRFLSAWRLQQEKEEKQEAGLGVQTAARLTVPHRRMPLDHS